MAAGSLVSAAGLSAGGLPGHLTEAWIAFTATNWDFEFGVAVYTVDTDVTRLRLVVGNATDPAWLPRFAGLSASFGIYCSDSTLTCKLRCVEFGRQHH